MNKITTPINDETVEKLQAGDQVLINGFIYTARDAAHQRLCELIDKNKPLPVDLSGAIIYFAGPTPPKPGKPVGSIGPTTSYRMDDYSPILIEKAGLKGMIGKGNRSESVINSMIKFKSVYFAAIGGAGALLANTVVSSEIICYDDLGPEAIRRLKVKDFPAIVAIDCNGNNLYLEGPSGFR